MSKVPHRGAAKQTLEEVGHESGHLLLCHSSQYDLERKRPLVELETSEGVRHVRISEHIECCFVRDGTTVTVRRPLRGTISAICAAQQ